MELVYLILFFISFYFLNTSNQVLFFIYLINPLKHLLILSHLIFYKINYFFYPSLEQLKKPSFYLYLNFNLLKLLIYFSINHYYLLYNYKLILYIILPFSNEFRPKCAYLINYSLNSGFIWTSSKIIVP